MTKQNDHNNDLAIHIVFITQDWHHSVWRSQRGWRWPISMLSLESILIPTVTTTHSRLHTKWQSGPYQKAVQKPVSWMHDAPESQNGLPWVEYESFFFISLKNKGIQT